MEQYKDTEYYITTDGKVFRKDKELKQQTHRKGYKRLDLWIDNKRCNKAVHRLVGETYIPNPDNLCCINHKDTDKSNNNVDNLEWITNQGNIDHAHEYHLFDNIIGENNVSSKLTEKQVLEIRQKYVRGKYGYKRLAQEYNMSQTQIRKIIDRTYWKHI